MQDNAAPSRWTPTELIETFGTTSYLIGDFDRDGTPDAFTIRTQYIDANKYVGVMEFWIYLGKWCLLWSRVGKLEDYEIPTSNDCWIMNIGILGAQNVPKIMVADGRSIALLKYVEVLEEMVNENGIHGYVVRPNFTITGWHWRTVEGWNLRPSDKWFVADIDGDRHNELFVANSRYFAVMREVDNQQLTVTWFAEGRIEGWNLRSGDAWRAEDVDGDGRDELIVTHGGYRAVLRASGDGDALTITDFEHRSSSEAGA